MNENETQEQINVQFDYEYEEKDDTEIVSFRLNDYPTIKFYYNNIRLGDVDDNGMVPLMFDLDIQHLDGIEQVEMCDDLEDKIKGLLMYLIQTANKTVKETLDTDSEEEENETE